jgi:hypothetical protein
MKKIITTAFLLVAFTSSIAYGQDYELIIKDHKFTPQTLEVPAGKKVKVIVKNQDSTPEEFESYELNREKIIKGNGQITLFVGPLKPGSYPFFGEFNKETAKGVIIAK